MLFGPPATKPERSPGRFDRLESEWNTVTRSGSAPTCCGHLQRAGRRRVAVDLGIALVGEDAEIVLLGQRDQRRPVVPAGHCALRVGGRAEIGDGDAVQHLGGQRAEIGQKAGGRGGRHEDRLGRHRQRRHHVDLVERVRHQYRRPPAALGLGAKRHGGVVEPLARAVQRHHLRRRIEGDAIAPPHPTGDGGPQGPRCRRSAG